MTGPLAQQIAQVRYVLNLMAVREACSDLEVLPQHLASLDAVDEIERHLHDMETALELARKADNALVLTAPKSAQAWLAKLVPLRTMRAALAALSAAPTATHQETK